MALGNVRSRRKRAPEPKLQITAMMDMFTIIMIFLLVSFSSRPDTFALDGNIELPRSTAKLDYTKNIQLVLSQEALQLDGERLGRVEGEAIGGLDPANLRASVLYQRLRQSREEADRLGDEAEGKPQVLFFCDKALPFDTINQVIKTAGMAGYPNLQFAVLQN